MASSYTDLGTELMTTGENAGNWGTKTNTNLKIIEEAIRGYVAVGVASADATLSLTDGSTGDSIRNSVIAFTGTLAGNRIITVPAVEKWWIMDNQTTEAYTLTVKVSGQTGVVIASGVRGIFYCDGSDILDADTASVSLPLQISQGGTGATTAGAALINLGITATGTALFTAADTAAAWSALGVAPSGVINGGTFT